ncbi:MAG TPA: UdgX family uracil-DNA binding protein [Sporichthyaceae bacterium]|jgi:DNA polymerase
MPRTANATDAPARPGAEQWVPQHADVDELAAAAGDCRGCELYANASQVVFGAGADHARCVLVGEQPGDVEDRRGEPFVGPAGGLLRRALAEVGLDTDELYLTNAVKHFRFTERGKRRLHQSPGPVHLTACRPWLSAELGEVQPELIVALGAIAGRALLGTKFRVTKERGRLLSPSERAEFGPPFPGTENAFLLATVHPSAVLRAEAREQAYLDFRGDLQVAATHLQHRH